MSEQRITIEQIRQWAHAQDHTWDVPLLVAALRRHEAWKSGGAWCVDGDAWVYLLGVVDMAALERWKALIHHAGLTGVDLADHWASEAAQATFYKLRPQICGCQMELVWRVDWECLGKLDVHGEVVDIVISPMSKAILARTYRAASTKPGVTLEIKL